MKTTLAKTKTASVAAMSFIAVSALLLSPAKGQTLVNYNFDSLTIGAVNGQDGWSSANGTFNESTQVGTTPVNFGGGGTLGLTNSALSGAPASSATKSFFTAGTLSSSDKIVLTFDAIQVTAGSMSLFGISATGNPSFGIWNGTIAVRSQAGTFIARTASNTDVAPVANHWYSLQSEWDLTTGLATLYYKDLTAGDTGYTQLYFNTAQTQDTVSLGAITPGSWTSAFIRAGVTYNGTPNPGASAPTVGLGIGYLDNLSVVVVPEPSTVALGALGLGVVMLRARRRQASLAA